MLENLAGEMKDGSNFLFFNKLECLGPYPRELFPPSVNIKGKKKVSSLSNWISEYVFNGISYS